MDVYDIQKRMDVDYVEASDIIKFLEDNGIVSAHDGSNKGRTVDLELVGQMLDRYTRELQQPGNEVDE